MRYSIAATVLLGTALAVVAAFVLGGCSERAPTAPQRSWEEVRYHWSQTSGNDYHDIVISDSGEMMWELQGQRAPARGLLSGGNLETLTRLIDALPSAGFRGSTSCDEAFFVSVLGASGRQEYRGGACDQGVPEEIQSLVAQFEGWIESSREYRRVPISLRTLVQGDDAAVAKETLRIARDRDELVGMLDLLRPGSPLVLPPVDFGREIIVGIFVGERPSEGHAVAAAGAYRTEGGQIVILEERTSPGSGCRSGRLTSPFVLVAVEGSADADVLLEIDVHALSCGPEGSPTR
ncbi:MAG: hypothetical protein FJY88_08020 [Candidatus Eisenbacteria bacterium]|nr:hypothetical protein [Candidatus Eisenbacteria bacterium]